MKKIICILFLILIGVLGAGAQISGKKKVAAEEKSSPKIVEREKFDPTRSAAEDLQSAITKAQVENKRIILDVGGEWCVWCRIMDNYLIQNADVAKIRDENFIWLKINMSEENKNIEFLAKYPEIKGYPHLFVLEKDGTFLHSQETSELEEGKSYNKQKFTEFLTKWSLSENSEK
ncbi:MAG: thioredoxin family protein [Actinomycetota bacterium]